MRRISILMLVFFVCFVSTSWPQAHQQEKPEIITFDVRDAGTGASQGTFPYVIVQGEWIAGNYIDANGVYHGFLRAPYGTITKFDVPGAGTGAGQGTIEVKGMTPALEIVGTNMDANNVFHGFLRTPHGKFTIYDAPGAGTASSQGTGGLSVNSAGVILGIYLDANNVYHGLLRDPDGTITPFDAPDAGTAADSYEGTYPANLSGINPKGASVGESVDANYVYHGYLRAPDGTFTKFDDSNAGTGVDSGQGTLSLGINPAGEISGVYIDANYVFHGYMRAPDGTITEYDVPGAGTGPYQGTNACWFIPCWGGINPAGTVTGFYVDQNYVYHGFLRTRDGKFTTFDAPTAGTGEWQGTQPMTINPEGAITGFYTDANNAVHGFLRLADRQWQWDR
jgi:hypothetical protein